MRITAKGQVTIPSQIREQLGLTPNSEIVLEVEGNTVRIRRAAPAADSAKAKRRPLKEEPFVGMWRDRDDMANSSDWVRETRRREWTRR
jgi:AbrB family looped-hinge helix DNA binding protein